ncbi:uracil-DNA glycosylase [Planctomyces sp. SH-PL14]|uniref:uracil-DNA glycosylase n=1 Tax=Planctomyces sp. SH-PL14 TaxID=1632864 RepID=UPI00078CFED6|nr:uracil-DNA glycosylase [Planctomyces sp. SH-PL14]AMV18474.1 Uracil DNA glycosylase superfamily protein [Planctomyces sp. SH-PL14]
MPNEQIARRQWLDSWKFAGLTHVPNSPPASAADAAAVPEAEVPVPPASPTPPVAAAPVPAAPAPPVEIEPEVGPPPREILAVERAAAASPAPPPAAAASLTEPDDMPPARADSLQSRQDRLAALAARVAQCVRCQELAQTRTQTVFGVGNPNATVMFIGEAPGADEDAQGEPFVGRAGQLLNRIITACGWKREDLYICNILRCRPPGNRTPLPTEAANCREYLDGQIETVRPEYIVCWGSVAAQNLMGVTDSIGKMRGRFYRHGEAKVLCTYHPSYLLRNPEAKKPVWDDMKFLLADMGLTPPAP